MNEFWVQEEPQLSPETRKLFLEYGHIPPTSLTKHVQEIRTLAWKVKRYPCIGSYLFLDLSMSKHPAYGEVLESLRSGGNEKTLLDLGCCLGQDLRKLAQDGIPGVQLAGYDIIEDFFPVGYHAFQDKAHFNAELLSGDFLAGCSCQKTSKLDSEALTSKDVYDFIYASDFFHLWSWEKQQRAYTKAVLMLKDHPGCLIFGRNTGVLKARLLDEGPFANPHGDHTWLHDVSSLQRMLEEVAKDTGRRLEITIEDQAIKDARMLKVKAIAELGWTRRLLFTVRTL